MGFLIKTGMFILLFKCEPSKKSVCASYSHS